MSREQDLQKELALWQRRLQKRKEQKATLGISADPSLDIEIEDIEARIANLQVELAEQKQTPAQPPVVPPQAASLPAVEVAEPDPELASLRAQPRIFLCHASEDKHRVKELYHLLKEAGYRPWLDKFDLLPGQRWRPAIRKVITNHHNLVLVCLSQHSITKRGVVQQEIKWALDILAQMPEEAIYLIPVRLEVCQVPEQLSPLHWVNLYEADGFEYLTRALDFEIGKRQAGPTTEPKTPVRAPPSRPPEPKPAPQQPFEPEPLPQKLLKLSRDPIWQMFGVLVAIIGVVWAVYTFYVGGNILALPPAEPTPLSTGPGDPSLTTQTDLNVWSGPDLDFDLLGLLPTGTTADIIGRSEDGQWWQIRFDQAVDNVGWVVSDPIYSTSSNVENIPVVPAPATPTPRPTPIPGSTPSPTPLVLPTYTPPSGSLSPTITAADGAPMVLIPSGPFIMGSDNGGDDEQPVHEVNLDAFYIDQYEVTNARYADCVEAGACKEPPTCDYGSLIYNDETKENHPVVCVDWKQAKTYCEWRGDRLPTEAGWEKAARGTDGQIYPWGNTFDGSRLNFCDSNCELEWADQGYDDSHTDTAPVGSYPEGVSPYGVYDMAGNAWEWVQSEYRAYPYNINDGRENLNSTDNRVLRGGSWVSGEGDARAPSRSSHTPDLQGSNFGFRCAADATE